MAPDALNMSESGAYHSPQRSYRTKTPSNAEHAVECNSRVESPPFIPLGATVATVAAVATEDAGLNEIVVSRSSSILKLPAAQ